MRRFSGRANCPGAVLPSSRSRLGDRLFQHCGQDLEPQFWHKRIEAIAAFGLSSVTDGIMERWFASAFRRPENPGYAIARAMLERQLVEGYLATCAAIAGFDRRDDTSRISVPTTVLVGAEDGATPPELVEDFAQAIPGSTFSIIDRAGHLPCVEAPGRVAEAIAVLAQRVNNKEGAQ